MQKNVLPIVAAAMAMTFTACQPTDKVDPAVTATDTNSDELVSTVVNYLATPDITGINSSFNNAQARSAKPSDAQIKSAFDAFDGDKSGQISTTELLQVLVKSGIKALDIDAKKYAKEIDREIKSKEIDDQIGQLIKTFDANNSGMIEFNEFQRLIDEALKNGK